MGSNERFFWIAFAGGMFMSNVVGGLLPNALHHFWPDRFDRPKSSQCEKGAPAPKVPAALLREVPVSSATQEEAHG